MASQVVLSRYAEEQYGVVCNVRRIGGLVRSQGRTLQYRTEFASDLPATKQRFRIAILGEDSERR